MYLGRNLEKLHELYSQYRIYFEIEDGILRVREEVPYVLNASPLIKEELKSKFSMKFSSELLWYIDGFGLEIIKNRKIKFNPSLSIDVLRDKLFEYIDDIEEETLKISLEELLGNEPDFFESPAAKTYHHAYENGLLEHIVQTLEIALALKSIVEEEVSLNKDIIIAGCILHDFGKINCYDSSSGTIQLTETFFSQEHIISGVKIATENIRSGHLSDLIHIIASHHRLKKWGSPIEPNTPEAWIIHTADNLSSKILG